MDWLDLLAVQETLKSLLLHHSSKASILWHSAFFIVQLSHLYGTTGKTIALIRWTFVGKVMSLLFNMLSRFAITFLPRSKCLLISWLLSYTKKRSVHIHVCVYTCVHIAFYFWFLCVLSQILLCCEILKARCKNSACSLLPFVQKKGTE